MLAIPIERAAEPLAQVDLGPPAAELGDLARVQVLAVDLARRGPLPPDLRLDLRAGELADQLDDLGDAVRAFTPRVERLAARRPGVECGGHRQVGARGILDVDEVSLWAAVGAQQ